MDELARFAVGLLNIIRTDEIIKYLLGLLGVFGSLCFLCVGITIARMSPEDFERLKMASRYQVSWKYFWRTYRR